MRTNYLIIDLNTIDDCSSLATLHEHSCVVYVVLKPGQTAVSLDLANALRAFGYDSEYVTVKDESATSHQLAIAWLLGSLSEQGKKIRYHLLSDEPVFDSLIQHMSAAGFHAKRWSQTQDMIKSIAMPQAC